MTFAVAIAACSGADDPTPIDDAGLPPPDSGTDAGLDPIDVGATPDDAGLADTGPSEFDTRLAPLLEAQVDPPAPLEPLAPEDDDLVALGEALFFDPILSGNKDVACASCHQVETATADGLPFALGTGASGRGADRAEGARRAWVRRHTSDLWNRGRLPVLFWDGRVSPTSTVGPPRPDGITDLLAIQALHPILDPTEMLGLPGDVAVDGTANELAGQPPAAVYAALEARLAAIDEYRLLFEAAFGSDQVSLGRGLEAVAAFQRRRFDAPDTAWDRYLAGDLTALSDAAKLGAILFYGALGCASCHSGALLSDGAFHNIGVPLLSPVDRGRAEIDASADAFTFRTPPLRNVARTPPYMHNGVFETLQDVLRHYSNPRQSAQTYTGESLPEELRSRIVEDEALVDELVSTLSEDLPLGEDGQTTVGLSNVRQFLLHLVDEGALERAAQAPSSVPSGLLVGGR